MKQPRITARLDQELEPIADACEEYLQWLESDDYHEDEISNYENTIVETVLETLYGDKVYEFINKMMDRERDDEEGDDNDT